MSPNDTTINTVPARAFGVQSNRIDWHHLLRDAAPSHEKSLRGGDVARTEKIHRILLDKLRELRDHTREDPYSNPIELLALQVSDGLSNGRLGEGDIEALIRRLTVIAFLARARRVGRYLGERDPSNNANIIRRLIRDTAHRAESGTMQRKPVPFATFRKRLEREVFGIVFTAHPTFSLNRNLLHSLSELAMERSPSGAPLTGDDYHRHIRRAYTFEHRPEPNIDLRLEHDLSLEAIDNTQAAMRQVYNLTLDVARELYPGRWSELRPRIMSVATWVGYDTDGRVDIRWSDTYFMRLRVRERQIDHMLEQVRDIAERWRTDTKTAFAIALDGLDRILAEAADEIESEIEPFDSIRIQDRQWLSWVQRISSRMYDSRDDRLVSPLSLLGHVSSALDAAPDDAARQALCVLRAEIANYGLGVAHTHVRINARQIHNAIRKTINMSTEPDDQGNRRTYLTAINTLLETVKPVQINYGSLMAESSTAKRAFMLVAQMLKYVDCDTPIRFLIAETETPFTLLVALYYARLFGVEDKVDISPLFETIAAFDNPESVIDECLRNPHYRDYLRKRGRITIQTGFSDAGRYLGQTTASVSVERLKMKMVRLLKTHGLDDLELVIFDTHGESIGRGAHPSSFDDRLNYTMPAEARRRFSAAGIQVKPEVSFQGGDAYLLFMTEPSALATVTRILEFALTPTNPVNNDPYYQSVDFAAEFFITIRQFQTQLMRDPNYAALLDMYGTNMLYSSGSRAARRQNDNYGGRVDLTHASQIRAIPHNSVLHQLGMLANTIGGAGRAVAKDPEQFARFYRTSPRFRRLFTMVEWAMEFSDLDVFRAYISNLVPDRWLIRASHETDSGTAQVLRHVSEHLEEAGAHRRLSEIFRLLEKDFLDLRAGIALAFPDDDRQSRDESDARGIEGIDNDVRDNLHLLHALRIVLIHRTYMLASQIPHFSERPPISWDQLIVNTLHLDVDNTTQYLSSIFPEAGEAVSIEGFGEPASYLSEDAQSYEREHERIFRPLGRLHELTRRISSAIIHTIGSVG